MAKKSFIIYQNWAKLIENLEDEKAGMLIKAICAHVNGKNVDVQDVSINAIFQMIADKITEDSERYAEVSQIRRDAVNKRWKDTKAYKSIHENTKESECIQKNYDTDTDTDTDKNKEIASPVIKNKKFTPPTVDDVKAYCRERGNNVDAETFVDFYTAKGWKVGNNPMKDWKACVRTWEKRDTGSKRTSPDKPITKFSNFEERTYNFSELEKRFARN